MTRKKDEGLTPIGAGSISHTGNGFMIREVPERYAGRPAPSQQLAGVPGDPSGSVASPGAASATPTPTRTPGQLTKIMPNLDPGPPEKGVGITVATDEYPGGGAEWSDPTELGPTHELSQVDPMYRTRGSDPPVEGKAEQVPYGDDPEEDQSSAAPPPNTTSPAAPASVASPISTTHVGDSRPKFGPGAPSAFSGGRGHANADPTPVVNRSARTMGVGADPWAAFSSTPKQFDHKGTVPR